MPAMVQGKVGLQLPASLVSKIGVLGEAPARALAVQLICEESSESEKVLMVPLPGVFLKSDWWDSGSRHRC